MSRPLVNFRAAVNDLLSQGIAPTPSALAAAGCGNWIDKSGRSLRDGHLAKAREEELIKAGWRRMTYNPDSRNFRWVPIKRKAATSEGHKVVSAFRIGDVCIPFSTALIDFLGYRNMPQQVKVVGYQAGALLGRDDLPKGATALEIDYGQGGDDFYLVWDDELILADPSPDYPLR